MHRKTIRHLLMTGSLLSMAACSGVSGDTGDVFAGPPPETLVGYENRFDEIVADLDLAGGGDITPRADIPASSTARYQGVMLWGAGSGGAPVEFYAGNMQLTADFDAAPGDAFSGGVSDIRDSADRKVSGRLAVTYGVIDRGADPATEYQALIDIDGNLVDADGVSFDVIATADGDFVGPAAEGVAGVVDGQMVSLDYGAETVTGAYAVKR